MVDIGELVRVRLFRTRVSARVSEGLAPALLLLVGAEADAFTDGIDALVLGKWEGAGVESCSFSFVFSSKSLICKVACVEGLVLWPL